MSEILNIVPFSKVTVCGVKLFTTALYFLNNAAPDALVYTLLSIITSDGLFMAQLSSLEAQS